jgi:hypothetical protein
MTDPPAYNPVRMRCTLAHIVSASYDLAPVEQFANAYRTLDPGAEHELVILLNRFDDQDPDPYLEPLAGLDYRTMSVPSSTIDLPAYAFAAQRIEAGPICFLNSHSQPLASGWLKRLLDALAGDEVGLVGATGSWEATRTVRLWNRWPKFPNPHLRTNAFMLDRDLMTSLYWPVVRDKRTAWQLESGRNGVTRQVQARGLRVLVVGREGEFGPDEWPRSATFRAGGQKNLLVADNRTRDWEAADKDDQAMLTRMAWGRAVRV